MNAARLHQRLAAAAALCALVAFTSGAGFDAPFALPAALLLLLATVWQPSERAQRVLEPVLRITALLLAARAALYAVRADTDVVAPMVDLLFLLLVAEALRAQTRSGAARLYALSFALLVAASAYRPGMLFGIAFTAFIVVLTAALVVGHIAREGERHDRSRPAVVPGRFVLSAALLSIVVLLTSAAVFLTFPRVSRTAIARSEQPARSVVGFGDVVSIGEHGAVIESNPEVVLRIEFPQGAPRGIAQRRWRGRSYHRFDGVRWHRTELGPYRLPVAVRSRAGTPVRQLVYARTLPTNPIFGLHRIVDVQSRARIWPVREASGDVSYMGRAAPVYLVTSVLQQPTAAELRASEPDLRTSLAPYLQLPPTAERSARLADSLSAGASTQYDRVMRVQQYLTSEFAYTRELPATARETTLEHFLFVRRAGHCEYFSTAMVVLLRTLGIPARNVNGFLGGEWNEFGNYLAVSQNNAHSWVEVWFNGIGWVEFDPTPAAAAANAIASGGTAGRWTAWMDGLEHRWNKWVLDYALEDQVDLLRRVTEPFTAADASGATTGDDGPAWTRMAGWLLALLALTLALRLLLRLRGGQGSAEPARSYLRLRSAYVRIGSARPDATPAEFVGGLHRTGAPGAEHAAAAVTIYLRGRFGPTPLSAHDRVLLRRHLDAALAAVRQASGAWLPRRRALRS